MFNTYFNTQTVAIICSIPALTLKQPPPPTPQGVAIPVNIFRFFSNLISVSKPIILSFLWFISDPTSEWNDYVLQLHSTSFTIHSLPILICVASNVVKKPSIDTDHHITAFYRVTDGKRWSPTGLGNENACAYAD